VEETETAYIQYRS